MSGKGDWLLNLPAPWMALIVFAGTYFIAVCIYLVVTGLAVKERARAFKAISPGMLPPLGGGLSSSQRNV
jgi:hypothetical protein